MSQLRPIRVLAVTSGKGGVGKTNVAVNLGVSLAEMGRKVMLLDADMGLANVDVLLGLHPKHNLAHVFSGEKTLPEIVVEGPYGLQIVPAASGIQRMAELATGEQVGLIHAFSEVGQDLDVFIVDTAAGISSGVLNFARACHEVLMVVCDEPTSITDAYAFIKLMSRDYGVHRFHIIANMVADAAQGRALFSKLCKVTDRYLDVTIDHIGTIPFDEMVRRSVQRQGPVVQLYPKSAASEAFRLLAQKTDGLPYTDRSSGGLEFFVERILEFSRVSGL